MIIVIQDTELFVTLANGRWYLLFHLDYGEKFLW